MDIFDVYENRRFAPPVPMLFDYEAVVWSNSSGPSRSSALRDLARFYNPFIWRDSGINFNALKVYLAAGGKLWIHGFRPARQLWPDQREAEEIVDPVNVTNWSDPIDPHLGVDSVGTTSLLYQMGVEMFDAGAGFDTRRTGLQQFCQGFAPAVPDAPRLAVDPQRWPLPPTQSGLHGRPNIEIYNMPAALQEASPALLPPPDRILALYTYVSGLAADPAAGVVFPRTADGQPAFLIAKSRPEDAYFSAAICGFEPHLLDFDSQVALCRYVLVEKMQLGRTPHSPARP